MFIIRWILRVASNFIWKLVGGIAGWIVWTVVAAVFALSVIGYPMAKKFLKIAFLVYKPYGKSVALNAGRYFVPNMVWGCTLGLLLGGLALINALLWGITIFGLPIAKQWYKVAKVSIFPFGVCISR